MTRKQTLEDLFLAVRKDLLSKNVSDETATAVARTIYMKCAYNEELTIEEIQTIRDTFLKGEE